MLLESAQLLCTAINVHGGKAPYKTSHLNHPSNVWCRATKANWDWLFSHYPMSSEQMSTIGGDSFMVTVA